MTKIDGPLIGDTSLSIFEFDGCVHPAGHIWESKDENGWDLCKCGAKRMLATWTGKTWSIKPEVEAS